MKTQAVAVVAENALTPNSIKTVVAVENQLATPVAEAPATPAAGFTLGNLSFTDASNHSVRFFTATAAQNTLDANGNYRYVNRRVRTVNGNVSKWTGGTSDNPARMADLSWDGSAWVVCGLNFESTSTPRDAQGKSRYNYCNSQEIGTTQRAVLDVGGKSMAEFYAQAREGGYENLFLSIPSAQLGSTTFPAGSKAFYTSGVILSTAIAYYPGRSFLPEFGNDLYQYGAAAIAGGDNRTSSVAGCASPGTPSSVTTLETLVNGRLGTPCIYNQHSFVYGGVTYFSDVPSESWGVSTVSLGTIGNAPYGTGSAPGYYATDTRLRAAFKGSGTNPVTYYACKERFNGWVVAQLHADRDRLLQHRNAGRCTGDDLQQPASTGLVDDIHARFRGAGWLRLLRLPEQDRLVERRTPEPDGRHGPAGAARDDTGRPCHAAGTDRWFLPGFVGLQGSGWSTQHRHRQRHPPRSDRDTHDRGVHRHTPLTDWAPPMAGSTQARKARAGPERPARAFSCAQSRLGEALLRRTGRRSGLNVAAPERWWQTVQSVEGWTQPRKGHALPTTLPTRRVGMGVETSESRGGGPVRKPWNLSNPVVNTFGGNCMRRVNTSAMLAVAIASALTIGGCGGGGGGGTVTETPNVTTTEVPVTVIDGAIENATVCLDKNNNGACDAGEPTVKTNAAGKGTLKVDLADVGKFPVIAQVGTDARDADTGPVPVAFTLKAPADKPSVVSPLTTLVHLAMDASGKSSTEAEEVVRSQAGINVSLFADFTAGSGADNVFAGAVARLVVLTVQSHTTELASSLGTQAVDGSTITPAALSRTINNRVSQNLAGLVAKASDPAVLNAGSAEARESALKTQVAAVVKENALTGISIKTAVAVENQMANPVAESTASPVASFSLGSLSFTDPNNHYARYTTATAAQNTLDANGNYRYVIRQVRTVNGTVSKWTGNFSNPPSRMADLSWNGTAWVNCPLNFESTSTPRDAQGRSTYNFCNSRETGTSQRAVLDISGKSLAEVYAQVREAGYENLYLADPAVLGSANFPAGSKLSYSTSTTLTNSITYYPGRSFRSDFGNAAYQYGPATVAGGDNRTSIVAGCASPGDPTSIKVLETLIAGRPGTPCIYGEQTFVNGGVTFRSDVPSEAWGYTTAFMGTIGNAPVGTGQPTGYYTSNVHLRAAFKGTGSDAVTYYACKERFTDGSSRNCKAIGTGSFTISTLGDARVMTFNNLPPQAAGMSYTRVFVERGGAVYYGYKSKGGVSTSARLNQKAGAAMLRQLGMTPEDPATPLALTAGSYQGTWDFKEPTGAEGTGITLNFFGNGSTSCYYTFNPVDSWSCSLNIVDPSTGAFTLTDPSDGTSITGILNFLEGTASGTTYDPAESPVTGIFIGTRR